MDNVKFINSKRAQRADEYKSSKEKLLKQHGHLLQEDM
jgi:hypothetical protein